MDKAVILSKIKAHCGFKKDSDLARRLGISPQTLSNWKTRKTYDPQLIYTKCPELNPEWLLTGKEPMLKTDSIKENSSLPTAEEETFKFLTRNNSTIPLFDLENNGGLKNALTKDSTVSIINFIKISNLANCDGAAYVKGNSMYPLLESGDIVIFKKLSAYELFWGEMYLIEVALDDKSNYLTIKNLHKSELGDEYVKLVSENPVYEAKDIPVSKINALALIRASIRFH